MKKFLIFLVSIVVVVCLGLTTFYFLKNDEVISIKTKELYVNAGNSIPLETLGINIKKNSKKTTFNYNAAGEDVTNLISYQADKNAYVVNSTAGGQVTLVITTTNKNYSKFEVVVHIGSGTQENPFYVFDESDLNNIGTVYDATSHFILMNDIALSEEFGGVCKDVSTGFGGNFNGNGHTISNLKLTNSNSEVVVSKAGLFNSIASGAVVSNLVIDNASVNGYFANAGILAGQNAGLIEKISIVNSNVTNLANGGKSGLVAGTILSADKVQLVAVEASTISIGSDAAAVSNAVVGGFAGVINQSTVQACYVNDVTISNINSSIIGGGFAGELVIAPSVGSIQQSYANVTGPSANFAAFVNTITKADGVYSETGMLQHLIGNIAIVKGATSAADIADTSLVANYEANYFKNVANPENKVFFDKASSQYMVRGYASVAEAVETNEYVFYAMSENEKEFWDAENIWIVSNASLPKLAMGNILPENPDSKYYSKDIESVSVGNAQNFVEIFNGKDVDSKKYFLDSNLTLDSWEAASLLNSQIDGNGKTITINLNNVKTIGEEENAEKILTLFTTITNSSIENLNIVIKGTAADAKTFAGLAYSVEGVELSASSINNVHISFEGEIANSFENFAGLVYEAKAGTKITNCSVSGLNVQTGKVANLGAVTINNNGTIENVNVVKSTLRATTNIAGVAITNNGNITSANIGETEVAVDAKVSANVGAVACLNNGNIDNAKVSAKLLVNTSDSSESTIYVAGIATNNQGTIKNVTVEGEGIAVSENVSAKVLIGGIATNNSGRIEVANNNMTKIGNCIANKDVRVGGVVYSNQGNIKDAIVQSNLSGNWVAGVAVEMNAGSAVIEEVAVAKITKQEEVLAYNKNVIYGDKYVAGIIVNFKNGTIQNVQTTSDIQGGANATKSSLVTLVFDANATLKNATINSSISGNGDKYRETWTDFALNDFSSHANIFGYSATTGMSYFNIASSEAYHGVMQSVVINSEANGVGDAQKGQSDRQWNPFQMFNGWYSYSYEKDSSTASHVRYVNAEGFKNASTYAGYYSYEYYNGVTTAKALEFGIGTEQDPNTWSYNNGNGIVLSFIVDYFA